MTPWKLTLGLAAGAAGAALFAPRLFPSLHGAGTVAVLPVAAPPTPPPPASAALPVAASAEGAVAVTARLDHGAVPRGSPTERYLVIELTGPEHAPGGERSPVDLAVVIDASGSMSDARKIDFARKGARFLLSELGPEDSFALVTFSDRAEVLRPLGPVGDQLSARRAIDQIVEGGGTNIGDGLGAAIREIRQAPSTDVRRVILLSDGQANVGETDPGALSRLAGGLASEGVTVSAIGLGIDFNEDLLARISDLGGGTYDFVDTPAELQAALSDELARTDAQVARSATVEVALPPGVALLEVIGWPATSTSEGFSVFVGDVYAGAKRKIVTRVRVTGVGDAMPVAAVTVRYDDLAIGPATASTTVHTAVSDDVATVAASADPATGALASRAAGNWYAEQSAHARKDGKKDSADRLVQQARDVLETASRRYRLPEIDADLRRVNENDGVLETAAPASPAAQRAVKSTQEDARDLYK